MRSQLTRNVYRRLLAGHGLLRPCPALFGRSYNAYYRPRLTGQLLLHPSSKRTFFGLFQKPPRELKEPELDPGYDVLLKYRSMETDNVRPPPREELIGGFRRFFRYKRRTDKAINTTQAFLAVRMLRHLLENSPEGPEGEVAGEDLSSSLLRTALHVVQLSPDVQSKNHLELAKLIYNELEWRRSSMQEGVDEKSVSVFKQYIDILTTHGGSLEAVERFQKWRANLPEQDRIDEDATQLWQYVLRGLSKEEREPELLEQYQQAAAEGIEYSPVIHEIMTCFFAAQNRVEEVKQWLKKPIHDNEMPTPHTYLEVIDFSLRNNLQQWITEVFEQLVQSSPDKELWDVILYWQVLALDKGVEDIKKTMSTMTKGNSKGTGHKPDADSIDSLLRAAIKKKNPYLAERFLSLGSERGIKPQTMTYILQMDYRLDAQDFGGAHAIYQKLQNQGFETETREVLPVVNKYLRLLCSAENPDLQRILDITAQLELQRAALEPETIVSLCLVFLRSDQQYDVIDTLSLHTVTLSLEERAQISKAFVDYCLDPKVSTARVWDAYSLLRQFFPETQPADRIRLMHAFFARKRPDMACNIFGHMRGHANSVQRPTADVYVQCFEGLGRYPNASGLKMVHNMLKMDTTVEVSTRVRNGLMIAYTAIGDYQTALEFWEQIATSAEGPSYNSLAIVFWACQAMDVRDQTAKRIWEKMQRMDLEVPPNVFWSYCGALAGQGELEEVKSVIAGMDASVGYPPSAMTLGVTYNALMPLGAKKQFEEWAREEYPETWARLESKGRRKTMEGDVFNIAQEMKA